MLQNEDKKLEETNELSMKSILVAKYVLDGTFAYLPHVRPQMRPKLCQLHIVIYLTSTSVHRGSTT